MSELRIVLLGKNVSKNSKVGNVILGTPAFQRKASSEYLQQHSVKISGMVEKRHITVINTFYLLQPFLSEAQITQRVRECVSLSAPGPHVFILVLQYKSFRKDDRNRVIKVLNLFSEQAIKQTIVLTTDEEPLSIYGIYSVPRENVFIRQLTAECGGRRLHFYKHQQAFCSALFKEYLKCERGINAQGSSVDDENSRSSASVGAELDSGHNTEVSGWHSSDCNRPNNAPTKNNHRCSSSHNIFP
ncbi:GTPase IMAP family member 2-like [Myxocyprinus asiaticus]|uniref:GTPase IMAP family member 2-like n=1 Tax=Myxocyprinus asiaticus TaxID=70543 RepID=UPI002222BAC4|nr:GTPase IMAP family member 2-like [Myxocyprinus asiaticus]